MSSISNVIVAVGCAALLTVALHRVASAQSTPAPGPTNPIPPNPQSQPGATIVINPTLEECRRGWEPSMRWTQDQFQQFCTKLSEAK